MPLQKKTEVISFPHKIPVEPAPAHVIYPMLFYYIREFSVFQALLCKSLHITDSIWKAPETWRFPTPCLRGILTAGRRGIWRGHPSLSAAENRGGSVPQAGKLDSQTDKKTAAPSGCGSRFSATDSETSASSPGGAVFPCILTGLLTRTFGVSPTSSQQPSQFPNDRLSPIGCADSVYTVPGGVRFPIPFLPCPFCLQSPDAAAKCFIWLW